MTKSELLNILYAERNRVEKQYARPGWTIWALVAAIASLGWLAWGVADESFVLSLVIFVFYAWVFAQFTYECIKSAVPTPRGIPVFVKTNVETILGEAAICLLSVGLIIAQLIFIPCSFLPVLYWFAFAGILLLFLLYGYFLISQPSGHVNISKYMKLGALLVSVLYMPMFVLIILYLCQSGYEYSSYKLGTLSFAIWFLLGKMPIGEKQTFLQIDGLINKVLYEDEEVDEKAILEELEVYIVGLRYGKYLSATKLKELKPLVSELIKHSNGLLLCVEQGNEVGVKAIVNEGKKFYKDTQKLYNALMSDVNGIYGDGKNSEKSLVHIFAVGQIAEETIKFWSIVKGTLELKPQPQQQVLTSHISAAYQATIGKPEIQQLIEQELNDNMGEIA